ncbi:MAG: hypothetical protein JXA89_11550 [Anaerolineae bacterium]|nr:hypothetical protein [Anaerolineae bacterium]
MPKSPPFRQTMPCSSGSRSTWPTCLPPGGLVGQTLDLLARSNSPLMLISLGLYLELDISWHEARLVLTHALFKYGAGLAMAVLVTRLLPIRGAIGAAAFLTPLMPTSLSTLLYSVEQGLNPRLAAMLISTSMLISMAIIAVTMIWFQGLF